ncbi:MAG: hypothetical protein KGZ61_03830 [Sandarakinorhabdus sp.]|nr:hypothetical protein [Sandarakinorhabdus sp.]
MHVKQTCIVKGAGYFNDSIEGTAYDNGQIFIEEPFDPSRPNYRGFRTVEYKCLDSGVVKPLMDFQFPITAEVSMEISATKRGQQIIVTHVKMLDKAMATPSAKV